MFDDQDLHESIQAFKAMGAEIELQPICWIFSPQPEPVPFETAVPYRGNSQRRPAQA